MSVCAYNVCVCIYLYCVSFQQPLPTYDEEDWLPSQDTADQAGRGDDDDDEGIDDSEGTGAPKRGVVSKAILRDLGNKYTGDEMDTIARVAAHGYYLRSLDQPESGTKIEDFLMKQQTARPVFIPPSAQTTATCPYVIPKPRLPAPPIPRGSGANDFYEALEARDQEIRKGENEGEGGWGK